MTAFPFKQRAVILAIAGIVAPVLLVLGLQGFASEVDEQTLTRETQIVSHGFNNHVLETARVIAGQAVWDDAAEHVSGEDVDWMRFNIAEFFMQGSGFDFVATLRADDQPLYVNISSIEAPQTLGPFAGAVAPLVAQLRKREVALAPLAQRVASGLVVAEPVYEDNLVHVGSHRYLLVAMLIQPDKTASLIPGRAPIMVVGQELSTDFLQSFGDRFLLKNLNDGAGGLRTASGKAYSVFRDRDGAEVLTLTWDPQRPGSSLLLTAAPMIAIVVIALIVLTLLFYRRSNRAIEQLVTSEKKASHLAYHDSLTGLPNRAMAAVRLGQAIEALKRRGRPFAVHCVDLDRFKDVNDTFGHPVGDELIQKAAHLLKKACRGTDTVARLGGDEFAIIQEECTPAEAAELAERVVALLAQPISLSVGQVHVSCSIGVTMVTRANVRDPQECLREADLALYAAKERGRSRYCFFELEMDAALRHRRGLQNDLREALQLGQLSIVYQPQVNGDNSVIGVEALMRWTHPQRGVVSPAVFIPLAEECGLIEDLGWFAMRRAFEDSARWPGLKIGINVSASQLRLKSFLTSVEALVSETKIEPSRFEFEITEGLLLADTTETHAVLQGIRKLGFSIALDDFGTGYSSLSYLKRYPINRIKIDRSFVSTLGVDKESQDVVSAIVRLAHALKLAIVAEGVETPEQRRLLAAAGCHDIQGFLASKPLAADQIQGFLERVGVTALAA